MQWVMKDKIVLVNNGLNDREFTVNNDDISVVAKENAVDVQTLVRNLTNRFTTEMGIVVETLGDRIGNAILTAMITLSHRELN